MAKEPYLIRRDKATRDAREVGVFYFGTVASVRSDGRVNIRIPSLGMTLGPILPINNAKLDKGDTAICAFTDSSNNSLIVFGSVNKKIDVESISRDQEARDERIRFFMEVF